MSPELVSAAEAPTLSAAICALLDLLGHGATTGEIWLSGRSRHGFGETSCRLPIAQCEPGWVPVAILEKLEEDVWAMAMDLAVHRRGSPELLRLGALPIAFVFPRVYRNGHGVERGPGSHWTIPREQIADALTRLEAFPLSPAMTIAAGSVVTVLWGVEPPIDVSTPAAQAGALDLQRRLSRALGAVALPDETRLADLRIPCPGFVVREAPYRDFVTVPFVDPTHVYDVAAIEAAVADHTARAAVAAATPATEIPRARSRARHQEATI